MPWTLNLARIKSFLRRAWSGINRTSSYELGLFDLSLPFLNGTHSICLRNVYLSVVYKQRLYDTLTPRFLT